MAFIVFEGLDGSGKTTQIVRLAEFLKKQGKAVLITREPGGTELGEQLREILLRVGHEIPVPRCELLIYEASRAQHVDTVIKPALARGEWVLCDRFSASSVAFQAGGRGLTRKSIDWLNDFATDGLRPDLTILIDLSLAESERRKGQRSLQLGQAQDRFELEKQEFHSRVREAYLQLSREERNWLVIDGGLEVEEIFNRIGDNISQRKW